MAQAAEGGRTPSGKTWPHSDGNTTMLRTSWCVAVALILALAVWYPAAAQSLPPSPTAAVVPAVSLAPTLAATHIGFAAEDQAPLPVNASAARMSPREGRVFAIVGGAALISGLLIGGDAGTVLAIGGAGVGLYGLYIWQR